ncbi:MAG: DUF5926 family protein, partial [Candidatus Nanopelagicales bacterium]
RPEPRPQQEPEPGAPVPPVGLPGPGPRLQDLIADVPLDVTIHEDFDYWMADETSVDAPGVRDSLDRANSKVMPTVRLTSVDAAYWVQMGDKVFLRWVMPHAEETLLNALARLHAAGDSGLAGVPSRFVGSFRADGLLVPVWELTEGTPAADVEAAAADFGTRLAAALAVDEPLTSDERRARAGLQNRQITLR